MSWFNALLPFVGGFFKGFLKEYSPPGPAGSVCSPRSYDFRVHMQQLLAAAGLPIDHASENAVCFHIPAHGADYLVILLLKGTHIIIRAHSDCSFPAGGVPRAVSRCMEMLNSREDRFSYDVTDVDDRSLCCMTTLVSTHTLTPATFQAVITTLGNALVALERTLVRYGFAG